MLGCVFYSAYRFLKFLVTSRNWSSRKSTSFRSWAAVRGCTDTGAAGPSDSVAAGVVGSGETAVGMTRHFLHNYSIGLPEHPLRIAWLSPH